MHIHAVISSNDLKLSLKLLLTLSGDNGSYFIDIVDSKLFSAGPLAVEVDGSSAVTASKITRGGRVTSSSLSFLASSSGRACFSVFLYS